MYRFESGAIGVIENVWFLPEGTPFRIHEQLEIIGTEGAVVRPRRRHERDRARRKSAIDCPDTLYWPEMHGETAGALRNELGYFVDVRRRGQAPDSGHAGGSSRRGRRPGRRGKIGRFGQGGANRIGVRGQGSGVRGQGSGVRGWQPRSLYVGLVHEG